MANKCNKCSNRTRHMTESGFIDDFSREKKRLRRINRILVFCLAVAVLVLVASVVVRAI